ncbi:MAG: hypothetical protein WCP17_00360 [bacterium]
METVNCQNCKKDFVIEVEDFNFYQKIKVPPPTFCGDCRLQRRLTFRNERSLYKRECELCGIDTISLYEKEKGIVNYCGECWWGDKWDAKSYGVDYDFSKPFFEQFYMLLKKVPHQNLSVSYNTLTNSNYVNMNGHLKDCYYLFNSDYNEKCLYGEEIERSTECVDLTIADNTQIAYESVNCNKCYQIFYSVDCESSHDIFFSKNLVGCSNCFGCINLRSQQYCFFNKKYSKEDYEKLVQDFSLESYSKVKEIKEKTRKFWLDFPNKYMHGIQNLESTGDYIYHSKYVKNSFIVSGAEHSKYCMWLITKNNKDCYDFTQFGENTERIYECLICGVNIYNFLGNINCLEGHDIQYSFYCRGDNMFGCVGLKRTQYCILNKQYSKEEYEILLPKIIKHMKDMPYVDKKGNTYRYGEFFPSEISQFDYNETSAQEFFPLTKIEAIKDGYLWKDKKEKNYNIDIFSNDLPDNIKDIKEEIISKIIECEHKCECNEQCTGAFRIVEPEFNFYKTHKLAIPRLCPNCRHYERAFNRNPNRFWHRKCMKEGCLNEFETTYSIERPEIVYCEKCYQQEVY